MNEPDTPNDIVADDRIRKIRSHIWHNRYVFDDDLFVDRF